MAKDHRTYLHFLQRSCRFILWLTIACGMVAAVKGAAVESVIRADVTHEIPGETQAGVTVPFLTGLFSLAGEQNLWYSWYYAAAGLLAGAVLSILFLSVLYWWGYRTKESMENRDAGG